MAKNNSESDKPGAGTNDSNVDNDNDNARNTSETDGSGGRNDGDSKTNDSAESGNASGERTEKNAGSGGRRRGRPEGSAGSKSEKPGSVVLKKSNVSLFATQLVGVHKMIGAVTGYGEIVEIDDSQGEQLATALVNIMDQYKIKVNPKTLAFGQLIGTMAAIYTPKVLMIVAIREQMKKNNPAPIQPAQGEPAQTGGIIIG